MCEHCRSIQTWRKFDAPKDYLACIAYIQQLVSEGEFELMQEESTCPLEKVKTEDGWADEITSASEARKRRWPKASPFTRMPPSGLAIKQEWSDWHDRDR